MSPYRIPDHVTHDVPRLRIDAGFAWLAAIVWPASVVRTIVAVLRHETFSQELSLALVLTLAIPWLVHHAISVSHGGAAEP